jgi:predicted alpha/beta hydrolase
MNGAEIHRRLVRLQSLSLALAPNVHTSVLFESHERAQIAFVVLPALGIEARYYQLLVDAFVSLGHAALVADYRGAHAQHGARASWRNDHDYVTRIDDLTRVLDVALPRLNCARAVLVGHSLGGQLALLHAAMNARRPYGAIALVASVMPYFHAFPERKLRTLVGTQMAAAIAHVVGHYPGDRVGFGGVEPRSLMRDWARAARTGRYVLRGVDYTEKLAALTLPVLNATLEGDRFAPLSAAKYVERLLPHASHESFEFAKGADPLATDHNRWPRRPHALAQHIARWAEACLTPVSRSATRHGLS